jgi:glyoxylase-like metal-dependent hydrolase (beta-lactamase superfamily II)
MSNNNFYVVRLLEDIEFPYLNANSYFVNFNNIKYIIDSGNHLAKNKLLTSLAEIGIDPLEINVVFNTHLHLDHCGNNNLFGNAIIYAPKKEIDFLNICINGGKDFTLQKLQECYSLLPNTVLKTFRNLLFNNIEISEFNLSSNQIIGVENNTQFNDDVSLLFTEGHCPGHFSVVFEVENKKYSFVGDAIINKDSISSSQRFTQDLEIQKQDEKKILDISDVIYPGHGEKIILSSP